MVYRQLKKKAINRKKEKKEELANSSVLKQEFKITRLAIKGNITGVAILARNLYLLVPVID